MNQMNVWGMTDIGLVRKENQDAYVTAQHTASGRTVGVVCDGMGGPAGGRVASQIAVSVYLEELEKVTLGGLRRAVLEGDVEMGSVMSGQVAGMLHEIRPVAEIFRDLYESGIARAKATAAEWSDAE